MKKVMLTMMVCGLMAGGVGAEEAAVTAYLGVGTTPVNTTLGAQLSLPPGVGLTIEHLDPESAAAKVLQKHDVLHKLNDQILVSQQQLAVLVRMHAPGEEITLTLMRAGSSKTVAVRLGEREYQALERPTWHLPRFQFPSSGVQSFSFGPMGEPFGKDFMKDLRQRLKELETKNLTPDGIMEEVNKLMPGQDDADDDAATEDGDGEEKTGSSFQRMSTKSVSIMQDGQWGTLTVQNGDKHLRIRSQDGKTLFNGPVNSDEERAKVPEELRDTLKALEKNAGGRGLKRKVSFLPMSSGVQS